MTKTKAKAFDQRFAVVSGPQQEQNHRILQPILTDLVAFGLSVKQLHWNVFGPHFRSIHLQLDEIYDDVLEATDAVAERIVACGHSPTGTSKEVAAKAELLDAPLGFTIDDEVLLHAGQRIHELSQMIRSRMKDIEEIDTVTADLLHQIVAKLEKHHWMLRAQR